MSARPGVFIEIVELPDESYDAWGEWYDDAYLRPRAALPGVAAARRLRGVVGSAPAMAVYDLDDFTVALAEAWRVVDATAQRQLPMPPAVAAAVRRVEPLVYRQTFTVLDRPYRPEPVGFFHGAFFEVPARHQDEFNDWYNTEHVEFVKTVEGYLNCRRFQALDVPTKFIALYDVVDLDHSEAKDVHPQNHTPWAARVRAKLPTYRERRLFTVETRLAGAVAEPTAELAPAS